MVVVVEVSEGHGDQARRGCAPGGPAAPAPLTASSAKGRHWEALLNSMSLCPRETPFLCHIRQRAVHASGVHGLKLLV